MNARTKWQPLNSKGTRPFIRVGKAYSQRALLYSFSLHVLLFVLISRYMKNIPLSRTTVETIFASERLSPAAQTILSLVLDKAFTFKATTPHPEELIRKLVLDASDGGRNKIASIRALRDESRNDGPIRSYLMKSATFSDFGGMSSAVSLRDAKETVEKILGR